MFTVEDIRAECRRLDRLCGVDTSGFEFRISKRSVKRLGYFSYAPGRAPCITVSAAVTGDERQFYDTVRHEYAHALVYLRYPGEHHVHDRVWKQACAEVGAVPQRLAQWESPLPPREQAKYIVRCRTCSRESLYSRRGKVIDSILAGYKNVRCKSCGGREFAVYAINVK